MSYWRRELFYHPDTADSRPLVACSACLLGEAVRYDGGHKEQAAYADWLAPWLQLQGICPEVGIGLSVPRPTMKVVDGVDTQRVVEVENPAVDVTDALLDYADKYLRQLGRFWPLTAWIFKARSPSCGAGSTPVNPATAEERLGDGAFAGRVRLWAPWLALYEEEDLLSETACAEMLLKSFVCRDILWQAPRPDIASLRKHYSEVFDIPIASGANEVTGVWHAVNAGLKTLGEKRRCELIGELRDT